MAEHDMTVQHCYGAGYGNQGYGFGAFGGYGYGRDGIGLEELILANQMANGHQQLGDKIHTASVNGIRETADAARDTVDAIRDSIDATNQIGNINLQSTERNGGETRAGVERSAGVVRDAIHFTANQTQRDFAGLSRDLCDGRKEVAEGFGHTNLEMSKQHCDIKMELTKQHAAIQLEACKQHADLARQADANTAALAKQLAECCCKLEGQHAETRQLIQSQALDECRRRESDLQNEVNLLKITASLGGPGKGN